MKISLLLCAGLTLAVGCAGRFPASPGSAAATPSQPVATTTTQTPQTTAGPYELQAVAAGPYISFTLKNNSSTDLQVKKEHFAVIVPDGSRQVIPYNRHTTIIDLPEVTTLKPGATIQGRALFKEFPGVIGKRLVYKPETGAVFAEIKPQA